jgi:hypothetical protein
MERTGKMTGAKSCSVYWLCTQPFVFFVLIVDVWIFFETLHTFFLHIFKEAVSAGLSHVSPQTLLNGYRLNLVYEFYTQYSD